MKIGILVDSSATAEPQTFKDTVVEWLPLHLTYGADIDILDTAKNIQKYQVYERIKAGEIWKTSQASPGELSQKYQEMLTKYDHIIHIPITENLSSMLGTALIVAAEEQFCQKVTVIKNQNLAAQAISLMALRLAKLIKEKKLTTPEMVVQQFEDDCRRFYIGIIPGDLKRLASGGRATKIASSILNVFKTKVLIHWQEKPEKEGLGRTMMSLTEKAIKSMLAQFQNEKFAIVLTSVFHFNDKNVEVSSETLKAANISYHKEIIPHLYPIHAGLETIGFIGYPLDFSVDFQ